MYSLTIPVWHLMVQILQYRCSVHFQDLYTSRRVSVPVAATGTGIRIQICNISQVNTHTHVHVYNTCTLTVLGETVLVLLQLTPCNHRANNKRTKPWQDGKAILQESVRRIVDRGSWIVDVHGCRELNTGAAGRYGLVYRYCRLLAPRGSRMDNAKAHNSSPWHVHLAMAVALSLALTPAQPWPWQRLWR